jgi:hypothetical protein
MLIIKNVKNDRPELTQGKTPACPGPGRGCSVEYLKSGGAQEKFKIENFWQNRI